MIGNVVMYVNGCGLYIIVEGYGDEGIGVMILDIGFGFDVGVIGVDCFGICVLIFVCMVGVVGIVDICFDEYGIIVILVWECL